MNLALKKRKALHQHFLSLLCDNHSSKTKEMLDLRCSYLPVSIISTYAGIKTRDAKRVSPNVSFWALHMCWSWQLLMAESYGKASERPLICLDLKVRALKYPVELDADSFRWQQHLFLPLLFPLSVLQRPTRPCWQELSSAPGWDAAAAGDAFFVVPASGAC